MKYIIPILAIALLSCSSVKEITATDQLEFVKIAQAFQTNYIGGSENCEQILNSIDTDVIMTEIQFSGPAQYFTHDQLAQFCPHLPAKEVISTTTEQRLLTPDLGYDHVTQLYLRKSAGDTVRETSSRIWARNSGAWKIIHMNNSLNKACDAQ